MTIQNPYPTLGPKLKTALDYIIANLPLNPTFENLNNTISDAIYTPDPNDPIMNELLQLYIKSVLPNVYNSYLNSALIGADETNAPVKYTAKQQSVISLLLEGIKAVPLQQLESYLNMVEEKIVAAGMSYEEQTPLFIATAAGKALTQYWLLHIPQPSPWASYMVDPSITAQAMDAVNYAKLPQWVAAGMQGSLLAYGIIKPPQLQPADIATAAIGAIALSAGKVVFKW